MVAVLFGSVWVNSDLLALHAINVEHGLFRRNVSGVCSLVWVKVRGRKFEGLRFGVSPVGVRPMIVGEVKLSMFGARGGYCLIAVIKNLLKWARRP